jgi:hypothetical protein
VPFIVLVKLFNFLGNSTYKLGILLQPGVPFACSFATAGDSGNITFSYANVAPAVLSLQTTTITTMRKNVKFFCKL